MTSIFYSSRIDQSFLSIQNLLARNLGKSLSGSVLKRWQAANIEALPLLPEQKLALASNLVVMHCLDDQIALLERSILKRTSVKPEFLALKSVSGIGDVLALTITLETGDISRFDGPGNFASYARAVDSRRESNGKKKGEGNTLDSSSKCNTPAEVECCDGKNLQPSES